MRRAAALPFVLCLLTATTASAHDTLPSKWCPAGTLPVVTGQFSFSERQLRDYRDRRLADATVLGSTCMSVKTCGIIDEWYWANQMAHEYALGGLLRAAPGTATTATVNEAPMPIVKAPLTFNLTTDEDGNGIEDHHDRYRFRQGLSGDYVVCRAIAAPLPVTPVRAR